MTKSNLAKLKSLLCLVVLIASACKSPTRATATPTLLPTATPRPSALPTELAPTATPSLAPSPTISLPPMPSSTVPPPPGPSPDFLQVRQDDWVAGPVTATVTIIVYSDFQCPACAPVADWLKQLQQDHEGQVRVVFRHFPLLGNHDKAWLAAQASEAAGQQGVFWGMHDLLFKGYTAWIGGSVADTLRVFKGYARRLRLDLDQFDLDNPAFQDAVLDDYEEALTHNLPGVPTLFINGELFQAPLSHFWLEAAVRLELLKPRQWDSPPVTIIDLGKRYTAIIETSQGDITVELDPHGAPITVNNFVFLARRGWYDGVTFFRVLPGYIAQTGDPTDTGLGSPGYELPPEIGLPHTIGAVAMARRPDQANPHKWSSGSQFFITLASLPELDGDYTVFGYVTSGMEVVQALRTRDPDTNPEAPPGDAIVTIQIQERPGLGEID